MGIQINNLTFACQSAAMVGVALGSTKPLHLTLERWAGHRGNHLFCHRVNCWLKK